MSRSTIPGERQVLIGRMAYSFESWKTLWFAKSRTVAAGAAASAFSGSRSMDSHQGALSSQVRRLQPQDPDLNEFFASVALNSSKQRPGGTALRRPYKQATPVCSERRRAGEAWSCTVWADCVMRSVVANREDSHEPIDNRWPESTGLYNSLRLRV